MSKEQATLIVCKAQRAGGSKVDLFGTMYHFKPESDKEGARHVASVSDAKAIHRLLAIKEGSGNPAFELADADAAIPPKPKMESGQVIGNEKPKDPDAPKDVVITNGEGQEINLSQMQPAELRELAKGTFKITVHPKWSDQTVIAKIVEATRGEN